ncbi:C-terminal binding protein [Microbacterium immunditiarum]|uniref:D-3-phosphoglycerate dehydrogenase n=1 Tax=Microbacterium immunditiarum TaxID=337480 RepID=A0A7Y9GK99_9MICO|nr:C-terminal binding protein [Microbacterium immunditiarum]NYE18077.1 D-3-phosphoglycerate dehydrogenase [Microbacterium immunditiarum]
MTHRILLTDLDLGTPELERDLISRHLDAELVARDCRTENDVLEAVREVRPDGIIVQWAPITDAVLAEAPGCRIVSRIGIGLDMVDLEAAARRGVLVKNVPHYCTEEVATHAVAMGLALWRQLPRLDHELRMGTWNAVGAADDIRRLSESTVGLIGMGRIGRLVADAYAAWGARVIVADPLVGDDAYERVALSTIAAEADLISIHAPLVPETHHIVDAAFLSTTVKRPVLVNVSRGALVDTLAAAVAVNDGVLSGLGLDVFESEPLPADHPVRRTPNTLISPHAAWSSVTALPELRRMAALNVVEALSGA